jgi:hypothetical protein
MGFISVKREHSRIGRRGAGRPCAARLVRFYISCRPRSTGIPTPSSLLVGRERILSRRDKPRALDAARYFGVCGTNSGVPARATAACT